jgi:hypothetical protein
MAVTVQRVEWPQPSNSSLPRISVREDPIMKMVAEEIKNYF